MASLKRIYRIPAFFLLPAGMVILCAFAGCQSLPRSGFDPNGERLFESRPFANCPLFNRQSESSPTTVTATPPANSALTPEGASIYSPLPTALPGDLGAARTNPNVPNYNSTATPLPPNVHAVTTAMIHSPDAGPVPLFNDTGGYALPTIPVEGPALIMTPREQIAPIGSEVVLIASYLGNKDRLVTNEKIEWTLEGVGTIEKYDASSCCDPLFFDCVKAKKLTEHYAVTKTSQVYQTLDRGTADTADDIHLLRGQTWVSVNSMKEGTTHVTSFAPNLADWTKRTDVGIIHWVDAQWVLPRLSIAPVGENRVLTTTVLRATNGQPRKGWVVRYEILNGPAAGLGASSAQIEEVETDVSGQATVILSPKEQQTGTNSIGVRIIRPAGVDGSDRRVTVGNETIRQTWSGNPNVLLTIKGPNEARLGQDLPYEITVTNRTSLLVQGIVSLPIPPLASYLRSSPAGQMLGSTVTWNVDLSPNSTSVINLILRQGTAGSLWLRPEFRRQGAQTTAAPRPSVGSAPPQRQPPGAATFPGAATSPSVPPSSLLPSSPTSPPSGAVPFPTTPVQKPSLTLRIEPYTFLETDFGKRFYLYIYVDNTGSTEAKQVELHVPLPAEIKDKVLATSNPADAKFGTNLQGTTAVLLIPSLPAGASAYLVLAHLPIDQQGYNISAEVYANGQRINQATQRITPQ
jgi:hypothetical protein